MSGEYLELGYRLAEQHRKAEDALDRVRALHRRVESPGWLARCAHDSLMWPCPTIEALDES